MINADWYYATWRPALNSSGNVELRPGPKWLSVLNVGPWRRRVETDIVSSDLKDEDWRAELLDEGGFRPWPGLNSANVRRWADVFVEAYLNAEVAARWRIRLGYADAVDRLIKTRRHIIPFQTAAVATATELAAEAKLLQPSAALSEVWKLQWRDQVAPGSCVDAALTQERSDRLSFYLRLSEAADYTSWLRGLALAARADDAVGFEEVSKIVEMFTAANHAWKRDYLATVAAPDEPVTAARIAARFTERPTRSEVVALASIAAAIVERRLDKSAEPVSSAERNRLLGLLTGCSEIAPHILAALGRHGDPKRVIAWAHSRARSDQGRTALHELATRDALPDEAIIWMLDTLGFTGDLADRRRAFVNAREWLTGVADATSLPELLVARLIDYAFERAAAGDTEGSHLAVGVVVRSPAGARAASDPRYATLLTASGNDQSELPLTDTEVTQAGLLARAGADLSRRQRAGLMGILDSVPGSGIPRVTFTDEDRSGPDNVTQLVAGLTSTHLVAFARFIVGEVRTSAPRADPRTLPFLEQALADAIRFGVSFARLQEVTTAAAIALAHAPTKKLDATALRDRIRCCAIEFAARRAQVEIAASVLARMPRDQREHTLNDFRQYWKQEREPEVKLALAATIVRAASDMGTATGAGLRRR